MRRATGCVPSSSAQAAMYQALWSSIEGAPFRGLPHDKSTLQPAEAPRELSRRCLVLQHLQRPDQRRLPDRAAVARKHPALDAAGAVAPSPPVQDSAVATCQPRLRYAASTASASANVSGSNTEHSFTDQKQHDSVDRCSDIVDHDAEPAWDPPLDPTDRPRLQNVEHP